MQYQIILLFQSENRGMAAAGVRLIIYIQQALGISVHEHPKITEPVVQFFEWMGPDAGPLVLYISAALLWWKRMIPPRDIFSSTSTFPLSTSSPQQKCRIRWIGRELPVRTHVIELT